MFFNDINYLLKLFPFETQKIKNILLFICFILHIQPVSAGVCSGVFKKAYSRYINYLQTPAHVQRLKRVTGLTDAEIKDSIILDVGYI